MVKIPHDRGKKYIGLSKFRTGIHVLLRWNSRFLHINVKTWRQKGVKLSTRRQEFYGRPRRYVTFRRFQVGWWTARDGKDGKPHCFGIGVYYR